MVKKSARAGRRQSSVTAKHKQFLKGHKNFFPLNSRVKTIKKGLHREITRILRWRPKKSSSRNLRKNGSRRRLLGWWPVFWGYQAPNCTPVAPSLLLWGTILAWGAQAWFGGSRPRNASRGAGPGEMQLRNCWNRVFRIATFINLQIIKPSVNVFVSFMRMIYALCHANADLSTVLKALLASFSLGPHNG